MDWGKLTQRRAGRGLQQLTGRGRQRGAERGSALPRRPAFPCGALGTRWTCPTGRWRANKWDLFPAADPGRALSGVHPWRLLAAQLAGGLSAS